ncbi:hypothetical protein HB662_09245 [Roseomonas frigidaquae]|uniref:Cthe-2314-like HEPN domain-containing protein n=1 Tax=Falsiroseomonas frigidaquae TaxID=487318 RepID=A0ABX1EY01_9PROT|nr:hypothetical protein [Falsiroseomonas frigidaquae]NKE44963.1 hypothetical protein [Falsiroseomonas frigidaquae]
MIVGGTKRLLKPLPIASIADLAQTLGAELFGSDEISGLEGPLLSRHWTPFDGLGKDRRQPADQWLSIASNAELAGDKRYAELADHISFSLRAAGIRLRDASDHYRAQLIAAIQVKQKPGNLFSNIPLSDLQLAFHSVLSELASARDYFAALLACQMGAPAKIDAMNRFKDWVMKSSNAHLQSDPMVAEIIKIDDMTNKNSWLYDLTEYRNEFLHRRPLGAMESARWLRYDVYEREGIIYPFIEMPLSPRDSSAPGQDALRRFVYLHRRMTMLLRDAITHARYSDTLPSLESS